MKIALVTPYEYPYPGGVTEHVSALDREFRARGHDTRIIAPSAQGKLDSNVIPVSQSVSAIPFSGSISRISLSPQVYRRVKKILTDECFDIVHIHEPIVPLLGPAVAHYSRAITVGTFHAYRDSNGIWDVAKPIAARIFGRLDGRIFVSEAVRDYITRYFPGKYALIPNGIDVPSFADPRIEPIARFNDGRPNILFVGRLDVRKGIATLLEAFSIVKRVIKDARLLVVGAFGKDEKESFVRVTRERGIRSVHFVGWVEKGMLIRYYRTATVFCAPSTGYESFGIVLLEAMASGVPIVASNIAGYRSVLEHCQTGVLVTPGDAAALSAELIRLIRTPGYRSQLVSKGREAVREYDWPLISNRVLDYYRDLSMASKRTGEEDEKNHSRKQVSPRALARDR